MHPKLEVKITCPIKNCVIFFMSWGGILQSIHIRLHEYLICKKHLDVSDCYNVLMLGRKVGIVMLVNGSMAECMDVGYMKSMNVQYL